MAASGVCGAARQKKRVGGAGERSGAGVGDGGGGGGGGSDIPVRPQVQNLTSGNLYIIGN